MSYITKNAIANAVDEIDPTKYYIMVETAAGTVDITPIIFQIVDASAHSDKSSTQWKDTAKNAWDKGIRSDMITPRIPDGIDANGKKKTKKNPGVNDVLFESLRQAILMGISVNRPKAVYGIPRPNASGADVLAKKPAAFTWSAYEVANCTTAYLVGKQDDTFRDLRNKYNNWAGGTYMGRLRGYLDDLEFPDRKREARATKAAEKEAAAAAAVEPNAPLLQRGKATLNELVATLLTMKRPDGTTMSGVVEAHAACCESLARLGQVK